MQSAATQSKDMRTSTHQGGLNYSRSKEVTQTQQQRPESPTVTHWHASKYKVHKLRHQSLCIKIISYTPPPPFLRLHTHTHTPTPVCHPPPPLPHTPSPRGSVGVTGAGGLSAAGLSGRGQGVGLRRQRLTSRCASSGRAGAWTIIIIATTGSVCRTALLTLRINQGPK